MPTGLEPKHFDTKEAAIAWVHKHTSDLIYTQPYLVGMVANRLIIRVRPANPVRVQQLVYDEYNRVKWALLFREDRH
jgi:glucose-6-phosphate 1-dehydrogenase